MKSLHNKLRECPLYEGFYKNIGGMVHPSTRDELRHEIEIRLNRGQYNLNDIDTSKITDMSYLFCDFDYDLSKLDISRWDTSKVEFMNGMFWGCTNFNCDLSKWNVSKVIDMDFMFYECHNFNSDLSKWNTGRVEDMKDMFRDCHKFNSDLSKWDVSKVRSMQGMFQNCWKFSSDLSKWDVSNVINMTYMFNECKNFSSDLSKWNVNKVEYAVGMFIYSGIKEPPSWYFTK